MCKEGLHMNREILTAEILRCQNAISIYNVDIQTKERELSELYELRRQYEDMEIETEYCINSSRASLLNDFPTCQSPRFLLSFYQELETLFFEDESESVLGILRRVIDTIDEEISIRESEISRLDDNINRYKYQIGDYQRRLTECVEEKSKW